MGNRAMGKIEHIHVAQDGTPTTAAYVLRYDENQWNKYNEQQRQDCYDAWIKKAEPLKCERVVLILIPDPLFPSGEHELPYVAWQHKYEPKTQGYAISGAVFIRLDAGITELDVPLRAAIEVALAKYPIGTRYSVVTNDGKTSLLEGRV